ncbi:MAG: hypothetical protein WC284_12680 [Candidimonas sp.]
MNLNEKLTNISNLCFSGGADGADIEFGNIANHHGHEVIHFSFDGHKSKSDVIRLYQDELEIADQYVKEANKKIKRSFPTKSKFVNNLLRRNWYQIRWTETVYAIAAIENDIVSGGTSWAVQMYLDRAKREQFEPRCFVFDQIKNEWFIGLNEKWFPIDPPIPQGFYTGIGSRKLLPNGKLAIKMLFE